MTKFIKFDSCKDCGLSFDKKLSLKCPIPMLAVYDRPSFIYKGCPLDDFVEPKTILKGLKNVQGSEHKG